MPAEENSKDNSSEQTHKAPPFSDFPALTLPKGGGAIRGIGEKINIQAASGTVSFSVPIYFSAGRGGLSPNLVLNYDSGAGNGIFGLGWNGDVSAISRKTEKKLPLYQDFLEGPESDVFILSGAEDLVPELIQESGVWKPKAYSRSIPGEGEYRIARYRPRTEGLFSQIEKWTHLSSGEIHWRVISGDNTRSLYGKNPQARITDPKNPGRVFKWLLEETADDKGNVLLYEYKPENAQGIDPALPHEKNRIEAGFAQRYLKRIFYGNQTPYQAGNWLFEAVYDYGEHSIISPSPAETSPWPVRPDPFSTYKSGFEIRTYRLCRRVLMFHRFSELGNEPYLVRSTNLDYDSGSVFSFLKKVSQTAYRKKTGTPNIVSRAFPALEFTYTEIPKDFSIRVLDEDSLQNLSAGIDGIQATWEDFEKEGLPGALIKTPSAWYYKPNLGEGQLGPLETSSEMPNSRIDQSQLMDPSGGSNRSLVVESQEMKGFWKTNEDGKWANFTAYENIVTEADILQKKLLIDLDGDGLPEIMIDEEHVYSWYPSLGKRGYGPKEKCAKSLDRACRPNLVHAGEAELLLTADMSGDGLQDIVRIRNGEIAYWPNLGWGNFGPMISMSDSPWFDHPDRFSPARIKLADIDGSGLTDLVYVGQGEARCWFNLSGNGWSGPVSLPGLPDVDNPASVSAVDLFGNGTTCLVWNSVLPGAAARPLRYLDLMQGRKPHLLETVRNNLGAESKFIYAASTRFYLEDKKAGRPWATRLPFPVNVVERVETYDHISRNRFVTRYAYHHGYYDNEEKEFRGFGMVEQWDTETYEALAASGQAHGEIINLDEASHVPPAYIKTWFHTGAYFSAGSLSQRYVQEYFSGDPAAAFVPDTVMPPGLTAEEERQACRALKNAMLRQEIYGLDGSASEKLPYKVSESNYTVVCLQPREKNRFAVFLTHPRENVEYDYERKLFTDGLHQVPDPRVKHAVTLLADEFGKERLSAAIAYGRRLNDTDPALTVLDQMAQKKILITAVESRYTNPVREAEAYRIPMLCESKTYEILNLKPKAAASFLFDFEELRSQLVVLLENGVEIPYEDVEAKSAPAGQPAKRLIERVCTLYRRNDLSGPLPWGSLESLALPFEEYKLAFTPAFVASIYQERVTPALLSGSGGYVHFENDANWWIRSGQVFYSAGDADSPVIEAAEARAHFFKGKRFVNAFGSTTRVRYDPYDLLVLEVEDPMQNKITAGERSGNSVQSRLDYRVLQTSHITDPNGNRTAVAFDTLGMVTGTAVMGKAAENLGDSLADFEPDVEEAELAAYFADPAARSENLLKNATTRVVYDLFGFQRTQSQPAAASTILRESHISSLSGGEKSKRLHRISYSDGFGREIQTKAQAEPGSLVEGGPDLPVRWTGSGWKIFNNKGNPIKKYEPFFSVSHLFEFAKTSGVSATIFYDPLGRAAATLNPDHSYEKVVFSPWSEEKWDTHDNILITDPRNDPHAGNFFKRLREEEYLPVWHSRRISGALGTDEKNSALKTQAHAGTPTRIHCDTLGRNFLTVLDNGPSGKQSTRTVLDIEGNQRSTVDTLGRIVMRYAYDMLGRRAAQEGMETGKAWMLSDAGGLSLSSWDSLGRFFRTVYDPLRRPLQTFLKENNGPEKLIRKIVYGESKGNAENHRAQIFEEYDGAGKVTNHAYDFKGNLLRSSRQFARDYKNTTDWSGPAPLEENEFTTSVAFDALNRPVLMIRPDQSEIRSFYNEANLLERMEAVLSGNPETIPFVQNLNYDAKGQRTLLVYGNGVRTEYRYDPLTFRLTHVKTLRGVSVLQNLSYVYDPAGNVTSIRDQAQPTVYFNNQAVEALGEFTYDAVYRLIASSGREHIGQQSSPETSWNDEFRVNLPHPGDGHSMRRYAEQYAYDAAGNMLQLIHQAANGNWMRNYFYQQASQIEPGFKNNCLSQTQSGSTPENYDYDGRGNLLSLPHLPLMKWNSRDQLSAVSRQKVSGEAVPETTYYVYDGNGQRVRKVTETAVASGGNPVRKSERLYLNGFELFCEYQADGATAKLRRETLHLEDGKKRIALVERKTFEAGTSQTPERLVRYQLGNHLGSASLEIDSAGAIISYEEYYPFGSTSYQAGRSQTEVSLKRYRASAKERDQESGFYYHGARYYAPWLGRWTAPDPAGTGDGLNLYAYAHNNPLIFTDPSGTKNEPMNDVDRDIMMKTDGQLYAHLKGMSKTDRNAYASKATGAFANRAWAMLNKYNMEREVLLEEVKIEGKVAKNLREYWEINKDRLEAGTTNAAFLRQEWDEMHPIDPNELFNDDRVQEIITESVMEADMMGKEKYQERSEYALEDAIMPRRGNLNNKDAPLNLNFAAADHFFVGMHMEQEFGSVIADSMTFGYDILKPLVPATGKQSKADERVADWAYQGSREGALWIDPPPPRTCSYPPPPKGPLDPGPANRAEIVNKSHLNIRDSELEKKRQTGNWATPCAPPPGQTSCF